MYDEFAGKIIDVNLAITAGSQQAAFTPATGNRYRLIGYDLSLSVVGSIIFKENTTVLFRTPAATANFAVDSPPMGHGWAGTLNTALSIDASATGQVTGWIRVVEEPGTMAKPY